MWMSTTEYTRWRTNGQQARLKRGLLRDRADGTTYLQVAVRPREDTDPRRQEERNRDAFRAVLVRFLTNRTARPADCILEMSGAFLGCTLGAVTLRLLLRRLSSTLRATGSNVVRAAPRGRTIGEPNGLARTRAGKRAL